MPGGNDVIFQGKERNMPVRDALGSGGGSRLLPPVFYGHLV